MREINSEAAAARWEAKIADLKRVSLQSQRSTKILSKNE